MTPIRLVRIVYQGSFLVLFLFFLHGLARGDTRDFPYSLFHWLDPLSTAGVSVAAGTLPRLLAWGSAVILLTLLLGRVFCGWICPLGTLQQLASFVLPPGRAARASR